MNKKIEKTRSFGSKVIKHSHWGMLSLVLVIFLGQFFLNFRFRIIVAMFFLGIVLSPLLVRLYRTGNKFYAGLYGGVLGLYLSIVLCFTLSDEMNMLVGIFHALYAVTYVFLGISVVFVALRKRLIHYIKSGNW